MKVYELLYALARMPPSERVYFARSLEHTGVQVVDVRMDPYGGGVVLLPVEDACSAALCPQCLAPYRAEDAGATCRECGRGVIVEENGDAEASGD